MKLAVRWEVGHGRHDAADRGRRKDHHPVQGEDAGVGAGAVALPGRDHGSNEGQNVERWNEESLLETDKARQQQVSQITPSYPNWRGTGRVRP